MKKNVIKHINYVLSPIIWLTEGKSGFRDLFIYFNSTYDKLPEMDNNINEEIQLIINRSLALGLNGLNA